VGRKPPTKASKLEDHAYCLPGQEELHQRFLKEQKNSVELRKELKKSQDVKRYLKKKVDYLGEVISDAKSKGFITAKAAFSDVPSLLMRRQQQNQALEAPSRQSYHAEIKIFSMTLSFYSAKAYSYVREESTWHCPILTPFAVGIHQ